MITIEKQIVSVCCDAEFTLPYIYRDLLHETTLQPSLNPCQWHMLGTGQVHELGISFCHLQDDLCYEMRLTANHMKTKAQLLPFISLTGRDFHNYIRVGAFGIS